MVAVKYTCITTNDHKEIDVSRLQRKAMERSRFPLIYQPSRDKSAYFDNGVVIYN